MNVLAPRESNLISVPATFQTVSFPVSTHPVVTHYAVDFNTDDIGTQPAIDQGPFTPSQIVFGHPTVEAALSLLNTQPLVFRDQAIYDQIEFSLDRGFDNYSLQFDVLVQDDSGEFRVIFDTPTVQTIHFHQGGSIRIFQPLSSGSSVNKVIGTYEEGRVSALKVDVDLDESEWSIFLDTTLIHTGQFRDSQDLRSIRLSHGQLSETTDGVVGVDNILITSQPDPIPDPSRVIHYDVDFDTDDVGTAPTFGVDSSTPSRIVFGTPTVEPSLGDLKTQPLVLRDPSGYDQIRFDMQQGYDNYSLSFDLLVQNSAGELTVFFDTPTVQNLYFESDGSISIFQPLEAGYAVNQVIGSYQTNQVLDINIDVDLSTDEWSIFLDETLIHRGSFRDSEDLRSIRFSHGQFSTSSNGVVGIDNILISSRVPAPSQTEPNSQQPSENEIDPLTDETADPPIDKPRRPLTSLTPTRVVGTKGRDILMGTDADDIIIGGRKADRLSALEGNDQFVYRHMKDRGDRILDFEVGRDEIVLTRLFNRYDIDVRGYRQAIQKGYLEIETLRNGSSRVQIDVDGTKGGQSAKTLLSVLDVSATDLSARNNFSL
ncbi:MAG: hypothetical protein VKL39_05020 [Leptolyngbyaceae bacterium]|nr:hypothetical protein [Leptolyngbyaceae bacterium]